MKGVSTSAPYQVSTGEVSLTVEIGDAQVGGSAVFVGGQQVGTGLISDLDLGSGPELRNKSVRIKTVVSDINDLTNKTSVTYKLAGGAAPMETSVFSEVEDDGDSMVFSARFDFV